VKIRRRSKLLVEPPTHATGDIAFNLIVFFLVCASVQPETGREQEIPRADPKQEQSQQSENIEVSLTRNTVAINGTPVRMESFPQQLKSLLQGKRNASERIVVVKSKPDTPYEFWIAITGRIEELGGYVTLLLEEERTITLQ